MIRETCLSEISSVLQGQLLGQDACFSSVSTDTRSINRRDLYVALTGPNFDGNDFVAVAEEKGACAAIVSRHMPGALPQVQVADTSLALGRLGAWNRQQSKATVVAITGSQGKTTVKEMIAAILRVAHRVHSTRGNLNNAIGVPLSLLQIEAGDEFVVLELGASGAGEIAYTVGLTRPDVVLVNNAAAAHLEGFGSLAGVVAAKGEIIDGLTAEGTAVLNADDPAFLTWKQRAGERKLRVFSMHADNDSADVRADSIRLKAERGSEFILRATEGEIPVRLNLPGRHNIANALAAAAVALAAGASLEQVAGGLHTVMPVAGRLRTLAAPQGARVIDDSYNASPAAFAAAIDVLAACEGVRILVAGDMAELGSDTDEEHRRIGEYARQMQIDLLWTVGDRSRLACIEFGPHARHFDSHDELLQVLKSSLGSGVTVLVKGSRSAGMDRIVKQITNGESS